MRLVLAAAAGLLAVVAVPFLVSSSAADDGGAKPEYVGAETCKGCHYQQHKIWKKTKLAKAMDSLKPTAESDAELFASKKAAGLDPAQDYSADEKCVGCHTTGYGKETGYPADATKDAERAKLLAGVQCEACHGPGSLYAKHKTEAKEKDPEAKFTFEDLAPLGLVKPDAANCATCHNENSPFKKEFKFEDEKTNVHTKKK